MGVINEEVCQAVPLNTGEGVVHLESKNLVDAERVNGSMNNGMEAKATPPVELTVQLSQEYKPGQTIRVNGPHGVIELEPSAGSEPGSSLTYRLAPEPEYRVQVPPGMGANGAVKIRRGDGVEIMVPVPAGFQPGDTFHVTPPALMVRMPEGATPGTVVCFHDEQSNWFRCTVPAGMTPGQYFAARIKPVN